MKKIVILSNHHAYTYNFRREIIQRLIEKKYKIYIILPYGEKVELLKDMGCEYINIPLDRRGMNPYTDFKLLLSYYKIIGSIKPDAVLSYTVKPNVYGGIVCRIKNIPFFPNITGLGTAVETENMVQKMLIGFYRIAYKKATCIFFQNYDNKIFFQNKGIKVNNYKVIPGSGVNTEYFTLLPYPPEKTINFMFISRIMKEKGIDQYLDAAEFIREKYPNTQFHVLGFCEENYEGKLADLEQKNIIKYHGMQSDVREFHKISHCTVHPTYYPEGMSNVLLESAATGRPIITTNRVGSKEIVDDNVNGFVVEEQNSRDLIEKIEKFLALTYTEKKEMGLAGRAKMENEFNREIVVNEYLSALEEI